MGRFGRGLWRRVVLHSTHQVRLRAGCVSAQKKSLRRGARRIESKRSQSGHSKFTPLPLPLKLTIYSRVLT